MLILGCGNADRGDDAAGWMVADRLQALGFPARRHEGDCLSLLDAWSGHEEVVLVDAMVSGREPGVCVVLDACAAPVERGEFRCPSSHSFGVGEAVELARMLDALPSKLLIFGIEGSSFEAGAQVSAAVAEGVERVVEEVQRLGTRVRGNPSNPPLSQLRHV